jgi:tetratricopeptide (TPR) repeat protein
MAARAQDITRTSEREAPMNLDLFRPDSGTRVRPRRRTPAILALLPALLIAGCDFLDPTGVENPRTTQDDLADATEPVRALLPGLRIQFARMLGATVVVAEATSDNYSIHGTGLSGVWDEPRSIQPTDVNPTSTSQGIYWHTQELRALADFILNEIAPEDETATSERLAEAHYYRGMAYVFQGENFTHVPTEADGTPRPASELLQRAVTDLEQSISLAPSGEFAIAARAGVARALRAAGDRQGAVASASQALGQDPEFVSTRLYDGSNFTNPPFLFLVDRALKELQPLPRLDFLDPKYLIREAGIPVAKAEEMHLILAEAALSAGALAEAREHTADAIALASSRATSSFDEDDIRLNADLTPRPRNSEIVVRADPESPFRAGLVLDRPGSIQAPTISGTSLDADSVRALAGEFETWHAFHLARQEILFLEGRRMSDLGIRLPMMLREIDQNPNIDMGSPGTSVVVPSYIPPNDQMNRFDPASPYDGDDLDANLTTTEVTILFDLNRILADNQITAFGG